MAIKSSKINKLVKKIGSKNPAFKNILLGIWELQEQTGEELEKMVNIFREFQTNQISAMKAEWHRATGIEMSTEIEHLVFNKPELQAKLAAINILMEYIELIAKAQNLAIALNLSEVGAISLIKKAGCWRRGGLKRADEEQKKAKETQLVYLKRFEEIEKKNLKQSPNKIHEMIGKEVGKSKEHVYKTLKGYYTSKRK